jgi:hypothetical protein
MIAEPAYRSMPKLPDLEIYVEALRAPIRRPVRVQDRRGSVSVEFSLSLLLLIPQMGGW